MSKRPSEQTLNKYRLTLARDAMIKKITSFVERRNNTDLLKIYRQFFRDDINSLALADSEKKKEELCTEAKQLSEQPIVSSKPKSQD